jgi:hypothetical protein
MPWWAALVNQKMLHCGKESGQRGQGVLCYPQEETTGVSPAYTIEYPA